MPREVDCPAVITPELSLYLKNVFSIWTQKQDSNPFIWCADIHLLKNLILVYLSANFDKTPQSKCVIL